MVVLAEIIEESSTSSSAHNYRYDVFISFRGVDTRNSFIDHLYNTLKNANIRTFLDDSEIDTGDELGPELVGAIKASRASIIVLSKNYASSTWCLEELVLILDQRRTTEHIVIPIFYHVVPTDVRKQQNSFGDAMVEHKQKMEAETNAEKKGQWTQKMGKWEKALTEVADLKGKDANNSTPETKLIKGIVEEISSRLELHKRSRIPKVIGMESSIRKITSFLKDGSSHATKILTIWGMAGIGKTHLADYIFKLHYLDFERSSFVEDIERKSTQPNGLMDLQKQLLKDIRYGSWMDIYNTDVGTCKIEELLCRNRTLLVLDGINKFEQLDVLIGINNLHPGSRIIITSKSEFLTEKCGLFQTKVIPLMHTKLLLEGLDVKESLQLLSWHAFGHDEPKEDDKKDSIKIIRYCRGHPLALKVLGSSLRNDGVTWKDIGESLGEEMNTDILKVLKISFDSLQYEKDKELFKHIACFFVREDRKFTEDILKACGICKSSGVNILINRCLLTVGSSNKLEMHQLLQDMGREIVRQENPDKPWQRSLLWHYKDCLDVLQNRKGTTKIQGFVLDMKTETSCSSSSTNKRTFEDAFSVHPQKGGVETHAFRKMCNLRLLQLNYVQLEGSYENFPKRLVWLCMHGFLLSCIPSHIRMENMVSLDLSNSNLQKLWEEPKLLRSLKVLNLSSCHELVSVGHFSWFPALERLILARCKHLNKLCESIGNYCHQLEVLDLSGCIELKELPQTIGNLRNLTELSINGCSNLSKFPVDMTGMKSLKVIMAESVNIESHVSSSAIMKPIPISLKISAISLPNSLVSLSLKNNNLSNKSFPKDFSSLSMLKTLYLGENPIVSLPDCVRSLSRLEKLSLNQCRSLKAVLHAPNTLKLLDIHNCYSLKKVTFHPENSAPPEIGYFDASTVTEIQDRFTLQFLSEIDEKILHSLGWNNIQYLRYYMVSMADPDGCYRPNGKTIPRQMLYEHGIFSTYLEGQEVPEWFTYKSNCSSFTLQSSPKNRRICGLNLCTVSIISSPDQVGPSRIQIRNLTKNTSWTYQPSTFVHPEDYEFENGEEYVVWLSHWMFGKDEFEDGDEVSIHVSSKIFTLQIEDFVCYDRDRPDYANVREYGISLVYEDGKNKEDPLAYYKSWKHIIGGDLSAAEVSSGHYLLTHWPRHNAI